MFHDERFCPGCGHAGVVVALDGATLIETRPEIRRHACGVGGPGSSAYDDAGPCCLGSARGALDHEPGCMEAGR